MLILPTPGLDWKSGDNTRRFSRHEDRCDARRGQHEVLDGSRAGGRGGRLRVGVAAGAPRVPGGDAGQPARGRRPTRRSRRTRRRSTRSWRWPPSPRRPKKVRLGTNVYNIGLRHPFVTARAITTLDVISRAAGSSSASAPAGSRRSGRPPVSTSRPAAAGSTRPSTSAGGSGPTTWSSTTASSSTSTPVMFNPKPVQQPQPSLLIGGDGAAAKRRAALVGDGWLPMNHSLEQLPGALAEINAKRADAGRDGTTTLTVGGSIDTVADIDRYRDAERRPRARAPLHVVARSPRRHRPLRRRGHRQAHLTHLSEGCVT